MAHNQRSYLRESVRTSRGGNVIPSLESFVVATSPFSHHTRRTPPCHMSHEYTTNEHPRANERAPPIEQKSLIIEDSIGFTQSKITDHPSNKRYPKEICWCTHTSVSGRLSTNIRRTTPPQVVGALSDTQGQMRRF